MGRKLNDKRYSDEQTHRQEDRNTELVGHPSKDSSQDSSQNSTQDS